MPKYKSATRNISGQAVGVYPGHFDKHFVENTRKRGPSMKYIAVFSPKINPKLHLTQRWTQSWRFFPKSGQFF